MIIGTPSKWTKDNAGLLADFLVTGTGQLFLATIAASRPSLAGDSALDQTAMRARYVEGYERAVNTILSLAEKPAEEASTPENYPSLDDDSKWEPPTKNAPRTE